MSRSFKLTNALIFQMGWFTCILTSSMMSLLFTLIYLTIYLHYVCFFIKISAFIKEISWLFMIVMIGLICEIGFFNAGILFTTGPLSGLDPLGAQNPFLLPPIWLLCLWALFATTLRSSLTFLFSSPKLGYALVLLAAPCSYYAGAKLNSHVELAHPHFLSLTIIGLTWAVAFALIRKLHDSHFKDMTYV